MPFLIGCTTTWELTNEFCSTIPKTKGKNVVFTLTDYKRDYSADRSMIEILRRNYEKLYFWVQGVEDYNYLEQLGENKNVIIIGSSLAEYENILKQQDIDYVGTRLHAGIKAMQLKRRSIIIEVDNRATDMKNSINLNTVKREKIISLEEMINSKFATQLEINTDSILAWKAQFNENSK